MKYHQVYINYQKLMLHAERNMNLNEAEGINMDAKWKLKASHDFMKNLLFCTF